jgi:hypothetical protein
MVDELVHHGDGAGRLFYIGFIHMGGAGEMPEA